MSPAYGLIAKVVMLKKNGFEKKTFEFLNQNLRDYTLKDCCIRKKNEKEHNYIILLIILCETVQETCVLSHVIIESIFPFSFTRIVELLQTFFVNK